MNQRFLPPLMALLAAAAILALPMALSDALPARAEALDPEPLKPIEPPATLPKVQHGDKTQNLDRLFSALKVAPDDDSAKYVENPGRSGSRPRAIPPIS